MDIIWVLGGDPSSSSWMDLMMDLTMVIHHHHHHHGWISCGWMSHGWLVVNDGTDEHYFHSL